MDNEPNAERNARRHAVLMRGVVTPILGLLAVTAIGLGIMNATEWKPSRTITARTQTSGSRYIVTDPGVAGLVDGDVTVKVLANGSGRICVASASAKDASGWLSGERYVRLTGLDDWNTLGTEKAGSESGDSTDASKDDAASGVEFKDSDMWSSVTCDAKSVEAEIAVKNDSDVALIDLGKKQAADISFTWTRKTLPDFATPLYFVGGLLALGAVLTASVFAMPPHRRRKRVVTGTAGQLEDHAEAQVEEVSVKDAVVGSLSGIVSAFKPSKRGGRRHAAAAGEESGQPTVVDPSARNLVADAADAADATQYDDDSSAGEQTSVISADELQAYFARLAQESGESFGTALGDDSEEADGSDGAGDGSDTDDDGEPTVRDDSDDAADSDEPIDESSRSVRTDDEADGGTGDDERSAEESAEEESR